MDDQGSMSMNWKNFPIPETIVFPLAVGVLIDYFYNQKLFPANITWVVLAGIFLLLGLVLMVWSVTEAGRLDMAASEKLITSGPYSISRNPMYVSWILIYLGVFFLNRSIWLMLLFIAAILGTHFLAVVKEEHILKQDLGDQFIEYCQKVRRYL